MESHSYAAHWEGFYLSSPIIIIVIIWAEMTTSLHNSNNGAITKIEAFNQDLFLLTFSLISGELLSFLFQFNNVDLLGWWPVVINFVAIYGFLFAFAFSIIALRLDNQKEIHVCVFLSDPLIHSAVKLSGIHEAIFHFC